MKIILDNNCEVGTKKNELNFGFMILPQKINLLGKFTDLLRSLYKVEVKKFKYLISIL